MIHMHPGSPAGSLAAILSTVGEYPYSSLYLLGNERYFRKMIHKLMEQHVFRSRSGEKYYCKLLNLSGKGASKNIRLYKDALPILDWVSPDAQDYYLKNFRNHHFPGDKNHIERNHRIAEAVAMCMWAGIEYRPYHLPKLQNQSRLQIIPDEPVFYLSRSLKSIGENEQNKTMFTRLVGAIYSHGKCFAVYNTRNALMKWSGRGEFKALQSLINITRLNSNIPSVDSAILFGQSDIISDTLKFQEENNRMEFRFDGIYRHIHFVPLSEKGNRLLKMLCLPDVHQNVLNILFQSDSLSNGLGLFEYDAYVNQKYILSHLDGDIARLIRLKEALQLNRYDSEVICFDFQVDYIKKYLEGLANIKVIEMGLVEHALGLR